MTYVIQYPPPEKHARKRVLVPGLLKPAARRTPYKKAFGANRDGLLRKSDFNTKAHAQTIRTMPNDEREDFFVALEKGRLDICHRMYAEQLIANSRFAADIAEVMLKQYEMARALDPSGARRYLTLVRNFERELNDTRRPKNDYAACGFDVDDRGDPILPMQEPSVPDQDDVQLLAQELKLNPWQTAILGRVLKSGTRFDRQGRAVFVGGAGRRVRTTFASQERLAA